MEATGQGELTRLISEHDITTSVSEHETTITARDNRRPYEKQLAVYLILASTFFERIAFYSISANLVHNLDSNTSHNRNTISSYIASFMFSGISYISTLLFAILSDAKLDRFKTINIGYFIYFIGYILAIVIADNNIHICTNGTSNAFIIPIPDSIFQEPCFGWVLGTLIIIAIGAGAIQSNMPVFGAEQVEGAEFISRYFDKHVILMNISAMFAQFMMSYIQDTDKTKIFVGYTIAALMLLLSAILFIIGRRYYINTKPFDTVFSHCIPVVKNAYQTWRGYKQYKSLRDNKHKNSSRLNLSDAAHQSFEQEEREDEWARPLSFLDFAKTVNHGKFNDRIVDDVKSLRIAFVVFSLFIPYWLIYDQLFTSFPAQRQHMKRPLNETYKTTITNSISFGDTGTIIVGLLIFTIFLRKYLDKWNQSSLITARFIIGMCFACLSMLTSGIVEVVRQQKCQGENINSDLSVYAQLTQNIFMGLSELFAMVATFEFAYFASRRSARSLFMSLRFFSIGISSFINSFYIHFFPSTKVDVNFICKTDYEWYWSFYTYFFILAGVQLVFIIIFIKCQQQFRIVRLDFD